MEHFSELIMTFSITNILGNVFYVLLGFIAFDIITGIIASAVERKLNSSINRIGLLRKVAEIAALAFFVFADAFFNSNGAITKLGTLVLFSIEGMSIIENFSRIGLDFSFLTKYFDENKVKKK